MFRFDMDTVHEGGLSLSVRLNTQPTAELITWQQSHGITNWQQNDGIPLA